MRSRNQHFGTLGRARTGVLVAGLSLLVGVGGTSGELAAQHESELTARDKSEIFIQHLVKFTKIRPEEFRALVLEYEIGAALAEITKSDPSTFGGNFIDTALAEVYPAYGKARDLARSGDDAAASEALTPLTRDLDPYVAANARFLLAEVAFRAGRHAQCLELAEGLIQKDRMRLVEDYRACELVAQCFEKLEQPLLEFTQHYLLLIDYVDVPKERQELAQKRLGVLAETVGRPLHAVAGWMDEVEKALTREVTSDEPTQRREREIVTALDKLIELQEAKERQTCNNCGSCAGGACRNNCVRGNKSKNPARVSKLPEGAEGRMLLGGVSMANADSVWGQLRLRDASRALQAFSGKLPERYERLLEQYYKDLSREGE